MYVTAAYIDTFFYRMKTLNVMKLKTHEQHLRLERELNNESWLSDRQRYKRLLAGFYGYWKPWESRVAACDSPEIQRFFAPRRKRALLEADLEFFGLCFCLFVVL